MKAIIHDRYGSPDVMRLGEVAMPNLPDDAVLVRVRATSINAHDWHMLRGKPYIARLSEGLRRPKSNVLGIDVAGTVEEVGVNVTHVKPGDDVYGSRSGAFAEYISGRNMVPMPSGLTYEQAAAVPTAGQTALQGLRDHAAVRPGERVLVNGAGGGVGSFAVQIAGALGAEVTAVTRTDNVELMRRLGAVEVIDYSRDDFTRAGRRYDVILDAGGSRSLSDMRRALTADGRLILVAPGSGQWVGPLARMAAAAVASRFSRQRVRAFLAKVNRDDLLALKELLEAGKVRPVIDRTYPLAQVPEAIRYVESGGVCGKVVITV
jgi:NADPH:quinone reductase-like Zn-dependent oxidoreductase